MSEITTSYAERNAQRQDQINFSTISFIGYFMGLGVDQPTAESQVAQLSTEVSLNLFPYVLGNIQPLFDAINASNLPFMDQPAKDALIGFLTF